jgi:hypothetical protein
MLNLCLIRKNKERKILVKNRKKINQFKVIIIDRDNFKSNNKNYAQ